MEKDTRGGLRYKCVRDISCNRAGLVLRLTYKLARAISVILPPLYLFPTFFIIYFSHRRADQILGPPGSLHSIRSTQALVYTVYNLQMPYLYSLKTKQCINYTTVYSLHSI